MLRRRWPVAVLVVWSFYVWVSRIVLALTDDTLAASAQAVAVALSLSVLALAAAAAAVLAGARSRALTTGERRVWQALAGWTTAVWLVRGLEIALADYSTRPDPVGFKVVHLVLAFVSLALAGLVWRLAGREGAGAPDDAPTVGAAGRGSEAVSLGSNAGR